MPRAPSREAHVYRWGADEIHENASSWTMNESGCHWSRAMPETRSELSQDSRWPAFFPSPISFVTTGHGEETGLEKVVGASIINRFPFLIGLSFCRETLSDRHHARRRFMEILEREGGANVQFLPPGAALDRAMGAIQNVPDERTSRRIEAAGLEWRPANSSRIPILRNSYLTYETRFVEPGHDFEGRSIFERPWLDVGSHRLYFMEIHTIRLREDIARGERQIVWRSLPSWKSESNSGFFTPRERNAKGYVKGYNPNYRFPATGTIAFEADAHEDGMAVKRLPRLAEDQVEVDNDRARWPCFFPSSVGMITCYSDDRTPNVMPCGSTFVVSRDPLIIAPCISYAAINERYAPRASLNMIRASGVFGCGVPYIGEGMVEALRLTGNTSFRDGRSKVADAGCEIDAVGAAPRISGCPIHFECEITKEFPLGTHALLLGKVTRIDVRADVTPCNPVEWLPWAALSSE